MRTRSAQTLVDMGVREIFQAGAELSAAGRQYVIRAAAHR